MNRLHKKFAADYGEQLFTPHNLRRDIMSFAMFSKYYEELYKARNEISRELIGKSNSFSGKPLRERLKRMGVRLAVR